MTNATYTKDGHAKKSEKLYADFYDHTGTRRKLPLFADQKNSVEAARAVERLVSIRASDDLIPAELRRFLENTLPRLRNKIAEWSIVDAGLLTSTQSLEASLDEWAKDLRGDDVDESYALLKTGRVKTLFRDAKLRRWNDITAEKVCDQLKKYRDDPTEAMSVTTSNHYLQAVKQFCKWMVDEKKRALSSPVSGMKPVDNGGKLVHDRRSLEVEEYHHLMRSSKTRRWS